MPMYQPNRTLILNLKVVCEVGFETHLTHFQSTIQCNWGEPE